MSQVRRVGLALCASATIVIVIAALVPRAYLVNDDPGLVLTLRLGAYTTATWLSPVLNRALIALYELSRDVPWYGLYCYGLIIATGAVILHTCLELVDRAQGPGRVALRIGAVMLAASHVILAVGITWTTVSIAAQGTASVALVSHLLTCQADKTRASWGRTLVYGLLFTSGFALREQAIIATAAALVPLVGWIGIHLLRSRHLPRPIAVIAFGVPFVLLLAVQSRMPKPPAADTTYDAFNAQRGRISDAAAYANLDTRAPQLLERAGWSLDDYRDFGAWRLADETQFTPEKVKRLADSGGVPTAMTPGDAYAVMRGVTIESAASVWLFFTMIAGGCLLAWLGVVDRRRALVFSVGTLAILMLLPIAISAISRFPQRVSLQFYTVAAFGVFVVLAHEIAARATPARIERRGAPALLIISLFMFVWAKNLIAWTDRSPFPYHDTLRQFAERVKSRNALVMGGVGIAEFDPLLADPRGYDALPSGWGTFTYPWFQYLSRFGIHSGSELLHKMVDNPNAFLVTGPFGHEDLEDWFRRRVGNPKIRLALADSAWGMPPLLRPDLYRLVTTPLVTGSDEWRLLSRSYTFDLVYGSSVDVGDRTFKTIAFSAPYEKHLSPLAGAAPAVSVTPSEQGLRCTVTETKPCTSAAIDREHVGIHIPLDGLGAARIDIALFDPANILGVYVYASTEDHRSIRWRWELDPRARELGFEGTLTLLPGHPAYPLQLVEDTADVRKIRGMDVIVAIEPGTHAGFDLRRVEISEP